jgi:hypothetical protein
VFRNCTLSGRAESWKPPLANLTPQPSAGVSLQSVDGGTLEQVVVSGITMANVRAPIFVWLGERGRGQAARAVGTLRKIAISNMVATGAEWTSTITGVPGRHVSDISLSNIRISGKGGGAAALLSRPVPEREREYPDAARFRNLPAHALYCRHVTRLRIERATLTASEPDARPALILDDVRGSTATGIVATSPSDGGAVAWLRSTQDCLVGDIRSAQARTLIRLSGAKTMGIRVAAAGSSPPAVVVLDREVPAAAVRTEATVTRSRRGEARQAARADDLR